MIFVCLVGHRARGEGMERLTEARVPSEEEGGENSSVGSRSPENSGIAIRGLIKRVSSSNLMGEVSDKGTTKHCKLLQ